MKSDGGKSGASILSDTPGSSGGPRDSARRHNQVTIRKAPTRFGRRGSSQRHANYYLEHADWHGLNSQEQNNQQALVNRPRSGRSRPRWSPPDSCGSPSGFCCSCQESRFRTQSLNGSPLIPVRSASSCAGRSSAEVSTEFPGRMSFGFRQMVQPD